MAKKLIQARVDVGGPEGEWLEALRSRWPDVKSDQDAIVKALQIAATAVCFEPTGEERRALEMLGEAFPAFRDDSVALLHLALQDFANTRTDGNGKSQTLARVEALVREIHAATVGG